MKSLVIVEIAAALVLAAAPQSPFEIDTLRAAVRESDSAPSRDDGEEARRLERRMQAVVRAWNSFATEYVARGTFNLSKAREVTKAWRQLQSETTWPKK